jgi:hypothetical protein
VYRTLTGKILVFASAVNRLGLKGRIPRPFVVVHSGNTQIIAVGFLACRSLSVTSVDGFEGEMVGEEKARRMARKSDIGSTFLVPGYERVKMGQKMPAR